MAYPNKFFMVGNIDEASTKAMNLGQVSWLHVDLFWDGGATKD